MIFLPHMPNIEFTLATDYPPDETPPGQGKRHRQQLAAAKRLTPQNPYETRQQRRARERKETRP